MEDYILNGKAYGSVARRFIANGGDPYIMRPFEGKDGRPYLLLRNSAGQQVPVLSANADATLRHEEWIQIDDTVQRVARETLNAVDDLRSRGLVYNIGNGMAKTVLLSQKMSDTNDAVISMDGVRKSPDDRPVYDTDYLPLPIIHKDFMFHSREIMASRNGNTPLDTSMVEESTRKCAEMAEKLLIGRATFPTYGGGTIAGYTNFSSALTQNLDNPSDSAWVASTLLDSILDMIQQAQDAFYNGPYVLYYAPSWSKYFGKDFKTYSDKSVRQRISETADLQDIKKLDFLQNYDMILVQMTSNVIRLVVGLDFITLQWETEGGMIVHFKVMGILVPQLRADYNGNTGIVYGSV